jgi:hypothetical protein
MIKSEIVTRVSRDAGLNRGQSIRAVKALVSSIRDALKGGGKDFVVRTRHFQNQSPERPYRPQSSKRRSHRDSLRDGRSRLSQALPLKKSPEGERFFSAAVPPKEKVAVAGLARLSAGIFWAVGGLVGAKGVWDCVGGRPEADFFSPRPWSFVTHAQWFRFAGFEIAFGLACAGVGWAAWLYSRRLPAWIERSVPPSPVSLPQ